MEPVRISLRSSVKSRISSEPENRSAGIHTYISDEVEKTTAEITGSMGLPFISPTAKNNTVNLISKIERSQYGIPLLAFRGFLSNPTWGGLSD
jgi:hypothetical protein